MPWEWITEGRGLAVGGDSARVEGARDQREGVCAGELVLAEEAGAAFRDCSRNIW